MSRGKDGGAAPPAPFIRLGPHVLLRRDDPHGAEHLTEDELANLRRRWDPVYMYVLWRRGEIDREEVIELASGHLAAHVAWLDAVAHQLEQEFHEHLPSDGPPLRCPLGGPARSAAHLANELLMDLPREAVLLAALAFEAGFGAGRLYEAEEQAADILAGDRVRRGGWKGAERRRDDGGTPSPDVRATAWREELEKVRRPDGSLPHGAISDVARRVAKRLGTTEEAERRFYFRGRTRWNL